MHRVISMVSALALCACASTPTVPEAEPTADGPQDPPPPDGELLLIEDVRILPMTGPDVDPIDHGAVLVRDGTIVSVGASVTPPPGAVIIDGGGATLMPGLIDMHVHIWDEVELAAYLSHGVTTVRNMSGMPLHLELAERIDAGELSGPRLITTGPILNSPGPNQQVNHQLVTSAAQARAAVAQQHAQGFRQLKVYSNLTRPAYEAIRSEAAALGMTITGHTPEGVRREGVPHDAPFDIAFEELLDDGFTTIEHMESIVWHGMSDELDESRARALADEVARAGVPVDPTLIAHHALHQMAATDGAWAQRPESGLLNPLLVAQEQTHYAEWARQPADARAAHDAFFAVATRIFHERGVAMVTGSDAGIFTNIPGSALTRELELLVAAGIPTADVLTMATVNGAGVLGLGDQIGKVAPGYRAEFILVNGDPLTDISVVEHPIGLLLGNTWMDAAQLEQLHASAFQHDPARTQANFERAQSELR